MEDILGSEWEISPAGGATGEAYYAQYKDRKIFLKRKYYAQYKDRKIFLKRNSSPFLAVLSAEGIVPKLIWTKRLENGDVITAQHWLNGHELKPSDMNGNNVAKLLRKIHKSNELLNMLKRLGKQPLLPEDLLLHINSLIDQDIDLASGSNIAEAIKWLEKELPHVHCDTKVVCHSDVNHNNWLLSNTDQLFLIDWDGAMIADPAIDIGMLLYWYINKENWHSWLDGYGIEATAQLFLRMKWYVISQAILQIHWYRSKNSDKEVQHWIHYLESLLTND